MALPKVLPCHGFIERQIPETTEKKKRQMPDELDSIKLFCFTMRHTIATQARAVCIPWLLKFLWVICNGLKTYCKVFFFFDRNALCGLLNNCSLRQKCVVYADPCGICFEADNLHLCILSWRKLYLSLLGNWIWWHTVLEITGCKTFVLIMVISGWIPSGQAYYSMSQTKDWRQYDKATLHKL